jgi:RNA polymerase sigma factor (sigma-70 family)
MIRSIDRQVRCAKALFTVAYRLTGDTDEAEDLVQDVCARAFESLPAGATPDHCRRWLLRVLYNRFVDTARARKRSRTTPLETADDGASALADTAHSPETLALQADGEAALELAWSRLDETQQALLLLRAEGYGLAEIGEITGLAKDVLSSRLHRARLSLARHLDTLGSMPSEPALSGRRK